MSASRDKLNRQRQVDSGYSKRAAAAQKEEQEAKQARLRYTLIGVALVLIFAFIFFYNSALPSRMFTAVTINGQNYSVAQLNYYYSQAFSDYYSDHIVDIITGQSSLDTNTSFADQLYVPSEDEDASSYPEGYTWRDYFIDRAVERMQQVQFLTGQAEAQGFTLPEEDQEEYDESIQSLQDSWSGQNYSSLQQYINLNYGKGVTLEMIQQELRRTMLADAYGKSLRDGYTYTDAELDTKYAEKADDYDTIRYAYYLVTSDNEEIDAEALAEAVDGTDEDTFKSYMEENYAGAAPTVTTSQGEDLNESYSAWLLDPARKAGDAAALQDTVSTEEGSEEEADSYVVMFLDRNTNDYNRVSFRHILINTDNEEVQKTVEETYVEPEETETETAEETETVEETAEETSDPYADALLAAAKAKAEELYDEWKAGDATEDSFAALAEENTDDSGSSENGGLYEEVTQGQMVEPINDWLFDPARKPGDTTVVTYSGDSYSGAHVVYFVGAEDETYAHTLARDDLSQAKFDDWLAQQTAADVVTTSHLGMVGKHR